MASGMHHLTKADIVEALKDKRADEPVAQLFAASLETAAGKSGETQVVVLYDRPFGELL